MSEDKEEPAFEWDMPSYKDSEEFKQRERAVHKRHCSVNGCKYGESDCPVASGEIVRDGIPEVKYDTPQERIWTVPVCRTSYGHRNIQVIATTEQEAIEKAIDAAGNESFSESDADYSAPNGAY